ncbi:expressed unknown protein [Ectocarpus siliculosus]|uniref:Zn(2)-C6 fungal-type domain-containing protein n=1 Tax=Ectocarpus siliculosus TaxID=2880 RepID=D8LCU9_ECTSI|nr:expressed unknown protein [Ectocarpus siliculosus]|eukprot:CBN75491.1 expressed unknown protein [Ectocarpus siliculosus]
MCRSCSECARKKKSCDGKRPCGRCVRSGDQCTYSERRRYGERARMRQHQPQGPDRNGIKAKDVLLHSTTGALVTSGVLPFKSHIRETMVKIMLPPASSQQPVLGDNCDEGERYFEAVAPGGDLSKISAGNQLAMDPSACTFWCAVALGALVKGSPIESVTSYAQLAEEALANSNSGPGNAEVAKAWVILANLHGFMGDKERFEKYLALSGSFLRSSIEQGSIDTLPVGFAEIVKFKDIANVSCGEWQMESFPVQGENLPPQLNEAATEAELYRYVSRSCVAFEEAIYTTMIEQSESGGNGLCDSEPHGRPGGVLPLPEDFTASDFSKALKSLLDDGDGIDFGPLQEAVDRSSIRRGIGVLFIDGPCIVETAAKGDLHATRERMGRCIEVLERYPGLCRCMIGCHMTHVLLMCLAAAGDSSDRAVYDRLRVISNSFRPPGSQPVPSFVEWRGVGAFCDEIFCRSIEVLVPCGHMRPFLEPPIEGIDADFGTSATGSDIDEGAPHGHGYTQRESLTAFNSIPGKIIGTAPVWPTDSGVESDIVPFLAPRAQPTSPISSRHAFGQSEAGLYSVGVARGVTTPEPSLLGLLESTERDRKPEDTGEDGIVEEDWLDAAHAISDAPCDGGDDTGQRLW